MCEFNLYVYLGLHKSVLTLNRKTMISRALRTMLPAFVILLFIAIVPYGCKEKKEEAKNLPNLKVLELQSKKVPVYLQMVGQAVGIPTVEIRARVAGYLRSWDFKEGSIVHKGQILFTIEPDQYKNDVDFAKADLENKNAAWDKAKLDVARLKPLLSTKAISQNDYDVAVTTEQQTRAAVASSKANLDQAQLNLSYTTIPSPITGAIGSCNVNPGNLVGKGEATLLTTVSAVDPMYVNFQMNETDYLKIMRFIDAHPEYKGKMDSFIVYLTLSDKQDYRLPGKIDFIDRGINTTTGTIAMRAIFENPEGLIKPGNFAMVNLVLMEQDNGIVIPQSATTLIQGKAFVFLVNDSNIVRRAPIILGRSIGNNYIVNYGLQAGDKILIEGFQKFKEGLPIKPEIVKDTLQVPARPE